MLMRTCLPCVRSTPGFYAGGGLARGSKFVMVTTTPAITPAPTTQPATTAPLPSLDASNPSSSRTDIGRLSTEAIHVIAQSVPNLPTLRDDAAAALAPDAEYRIREIVQDSLKFMRHAKRHRLTTNDINAALRLRNVEPLYGFGPSQTSSSNAAATAAAAASAAAVAASAAAAAASVAASSAALPDGDETTAGPAVTIMNTAIEMASAPESMAAVAAAVTAAAAAAAAAKESSAASLSTQFRRVDGPGHLFFVEDAEVHLRSLIQTPLPAVPLDYAVSAHWLAIDGVQPAVPQNPVEANGNGQATADADADPTGGGAATGILSSKCADPIVKPRVKHVLGKELQLYYEHVTAALVGNDAAQRDACIISVAEEPGLVQLLPYFTLHIRDSAHKSLRNLPFLFSLMRLSRALLTNPHFKVETYLHQLLPPILTCLVGKRLCAKPRENHWALRDFAAELIAIICAKYGPAYSSVQPRITKTLNDALMDVKRPLTTHYGAIVGLGVLGAHVVDLLLVPSIVDYSNLVLTVLDDTADKPKSIRRMEAAKVYGALAWAVCISLKRTDRAVLQADAVGFAAVPASDINAVLPSYSERAIALKSSYGDNFLPSTAVSANASRISLTMFEDVSAAAAAQSR
jgi:histone H3/H4